MRLQRTSPTIYGFQAPAATPGQTKNNTLVAPLTSGLTQDVFVSRVKFGAHNSPEVTIRDAISTDVLKLTKIAFAYSQAHQLPEPSEEKFKTVIGKRIADAEQNPQNTMFKVAVAGQKPVGYLAAEVKGDKITLYQNTNSEAKGKEAIFGQLALAALPWAERHQDKKLALSVLERNEKAISLYRELGFTERDVPQTKPGFLLMESAMADTCARVREKYAS